MAYNFSNTYKQPIEKFSMPEGGGGITGLLSGLSSGYAAGKNMKARNKENKTFKEDFMSMIGTEPTQEEIDMNLRNRGIRPGNFVSDFTGAALGAEGVGKMAKNPLLREQIQNIQLGNQRQQQENTLFDQLTRDAGGMVQDFSNLSTTEERLNFLKKNAGKTLTREGAQLMNQFAQITQQLAVLENKSEAALIAHEQRKKKAEISSIYGEYTPDNEVRYNTKKSFEEILKDFSRDNITFKEVPSGVIDKDGFIDWPRLFQWKAQLQEDEAANPTSVRIYEDPENGQRYVLRGGQMIKSGLASDVEEQNMLLEVELQSISDQLKSIRTDPLRGHFNQENEKKIQELETRQKELIRSRFAARRKNTTPATSGSDSSEFQSTDSNPVAIKIAPNGKKALFDSVTKKFLRYAE